MVDPDPINPWHILNAVLGCFVALMGWVGNKQVDRIDALEKEKASKSDIEEIKEGLNQLYTRGEERHKNVTDRLDRLLERERE